MTDQPAIAARGEDLKERPEDAARRFAQEVFDLAAERDQLKVEILELMDAARAAGVRLAHHMMKEEEISGEPHALDVVVMNQINATVKSAITGIDSRLPEARQSPVGQSPEGVGR